MTNTALIFGGTGAIGSNLARRLAGRDFHVVLAARNADRLASLASDVGGSYTTADATKESDVVAAFKEASQHGGIKAVAHCVGSVYLKPLHLTSTADWQEVMDLNLTSAYFVLREAVKAMRRTGGSAVLASSAAARIGLANHEAIAAAKAGIIGLVQSAAATYAPAGIRINAVAPGLVESTMTERIVKNEASLKVSKEMHPLGRIGQGADVAAAMEWLLDPAQGWITGQVLGVDGGLGVIKTR